MQRGQEERARREETQRDGFGINQRMEETTKDLVRTANGPKQIGAGKKAAPNKKFVFVDDNGDFDQEDADDEELIDQGLQATLQKAQMLGKVSDLLGEDIERSNQRLGRIADKVSSIYPRLLFWDLANVCVDRCRGRPCPYEQSQTEPDSLRGTYRWYFAPKLERKASHKWTQGLQKLASLCGSLYSLAITASDGERIVDILVEHGLCAVV